MKPLPYEIELEKVLLTIRMVIPHFKVPPTYMFEFIEKLDRLGHYTSRGEIALSMQTIGDFSCKNKQFVRTIVHEVVHLNHWELGHSNEFHKINDMLLERVWNKLEEMKTKGGQNEQDIRQE